MITSNYKVLSTPNRSGTDSGKYLPVTYINIDGTTTTVSGSYVANCAYHCQNTALLVPGSGTTAPTASDYCAENEITELTETGSGTDFSSKTAVTYEMPYHFLTVTRTFRNDTDSNITVAEICFYGKPTNNGGQKYAMLAREVISPVVIAPGESYSFSLTIGEE